MTDPVWWIWYPSSRGWKRKRNNWTLR